MRRAAGVAALLALGACGPAAWAVDADGATNLAGLYETPLDAD
jgi:hypothetical protein